MTCLSCRWSRSKDGKLVCIKWDCEADHRCSAFQYEPGTDESLLRTTMILFVQNSEQRTHNVCTQQGQPR